MKHFNVNTLRVGATPCPDDLSGHRGAKRGGILGDPGIFSREFLNPKESASRTGEIGREDPRDKVWLEVLILT